MLHKVENNPEGELLKKEKGINIFGLAKCVNSVKEMNIERIQE